MYCCHMEEKTLQYRNLAQEIITFCHFDSMASFRYHEFEEARLGATAFILGQKVIPLANHWSLHSDQPSGNRNWSQRQGLALMKEFIILQAKRITIPSAALTSFFVSSVDACCASQCPAKAGARSWLTIFQDYSYRPLYSTSFTSFPERQHNVVLLDSSSPIYGANR